MRALAFSTFPSFRVLNRQTVDVQMVVQSAIGLSLKQEGECELECKEKLSETEVEEEAWGCGVRSIQTSPAGAGTSLGDSLEEFRESQGECLGGKTCSSGEPFSCSRYCQLVDVA